MTTRIGRRDFLTTAGLAASATLLGSSLLHPSSVFASPSYVRRDVGTMDASDPILVSYRTAITKMQALNTTTPLSPLSWNYQAAIHGTTLPGSMTAWRTCQHGNYFFWSWHRMYLYWFERIIRTMAEDVCWALPYWNYCLPSTEQALPGPFLDNTSILWVPGRNLNSPSATLSGSAVLCDTAISPPDFTADSSSIENTPHNAVHVQTGGIMGSVPTAAGDPIFYLHHANIDRLWDLYLAQSPGAADPVGDATWANTQFTFFDENAFQVQMTGCDILRAQQQLGYSYEGEPPQVNDYCFKPHPRPFVFEHEILIRLPGPPVELASEPVSIPIEIGELRERLAALADSKTERVFLELDDVEADKPPGIIWEVYLGLPAGAEASAKSPNYIGNVALFGTGIRSDAHHEFKAAHFAFPVGRAIVASLKANERRLSVTFVPVGVLIDGKPSRPKAESTVHIRRASLTVERKERKERKEPK